MENLGELVVMEDGPGMLSQVTIISTIYYAAAISETQFSARKKSEITVLPIEPYCQKDTFYISH